MSHLKQPRIVQSFVQNQLGISGVSLIAKFCVTIKMPKFWTNNTSIGYFWGGILRNYCHIWNQCPGMFLITKFRLRLKMPKFWTKKMLSLGISGKEFEKAIVIIEINALKFF